MRVSAKTISDTLTKAGRLTRRVIGVYARDERPAEAVAVSSVVASGHPCMAKALFKMAMRPGVPPIVVGRDTGGKSCPGLMMWFGFLPFPPGVEAMFSSDSADPDSFCIKRTSALAAATLRDMGTFTFAGKYVVMQALDDADDAMDGLRSVLCFGDAEQIRNLGALVHFDEARAFAPIVAPWGSGCATFVAFPAGMASDVPVNTAFLSPMVPEANAWLPADTFALGIPIGIAARMAEGYETSFAVRRPEMAYPAIKEEV